MKRIYAEKGSCMVAVSEGIHYEDGGFVSEAKVRSANDGFGHAQLGGLAAILAQVLKEAHRRQGPWHRAESAAALRRTSGLRDGYRGVLYGGQGRRGKRRQRHQRPAWSVLSVASGTASYACKTKLIPLMEVANVEKKVPREWINAEGNGVNQPVH